MENDAKKQRIPWLAYCALGAVGLWLGVGIVAQPRALSEWHSSYTEAAEVQEHPIAAALVYNQRQREAAVRYALAYQDLDGASFLTAPWYMWECSRRREAWLRERKR